MKKETIIKGVAVAPFVIIALAILGLIVWVHVWGFDQAGWKVFIPVAMIGFSSWMAWGFHYWFESD